MTGSGRGCPVKRVSEAARALLKGLEPQEAAQVARRRKPRGEAAELLPEHTFWEVVAQVCENYRAR